MTLVRASRRQRSRRRQRQFVNYPASTDVTKRWTRQQFYSSVASAASGQSDCSKYSRDGKCAFIGTRVRAMGDDETLIEAVREFDCLWKVKSKAYKDLRAKENAWKVVAEKV